MYYADRDTFGIGDPVAGLAKPTPMLQVSDVPQLSNVSPLPKLAKARAVSGTDLVSAKNIIGCCVYNHHAEKLGNIKEMMLDTRSGKVSSAVLSFGGFGGFGQKHFVVPWTALMLDKKRQCFVLNVEKSHLRNSPGFQ